MTTAFHRTEYKLAYLAASVAIDIDPGESLLSELAGLTRSLEDLVDACRAMRDAAKFDRVASALRLLRDRERERVRNGQVRP